MEKGKLSQNKSTGRCEGSAECDDCPAMFAAVKPAVKTVSAQPSERVIAAGGPLVVTVIEDTHKVRHKL
jgi:hypothetical protein